MDCVEPTILNSNLLPVNANGDVLFLSVASIVNVGSVDAPDTYVLPFGDSVASPFSMICSTIDWSCSPRNAEMIAGGASFAPSL